VTDRQTYGQTYGRTDRILIAKAVCIPCSAVKTGIKSENAEHESVIQAISRIHGLITIQLVPKTVTFTRDRLKER